MVDCQEHDKLAQKATATRSNPCPHNYLSEFVTNPEDLLYLMNSSILLFIISTLPFTELFGNEKNFPCISYLNQHWLFPFCFNHCSNSTITTLIQLLQVKLIIARALLVNLFCIMFWSLQSLSEWLECNTVPALPSLFELHLYLSIPCFINHYLIAFHFPAVCTWLPLFL